jgi:hypothetical protein
MTYSARLAAAMPDSVEIEPVRAILSEAQKAGLDPRKIYEATAAIRPERWMEAPPYEIVAPQP